MQSQPSTFFVTDAAGERYTGRVVPGQGRRARVVQGILYPSGSLHLPRRPPSRGYYPVLGTHPGYTTWVHTWIHTTWYTTWYTTRARYYPALLHCSTRARYYPALLYYLCTPAIRHLEQPAVHPRHGTCRHRVVAGYLGVLLQAPPSSRAFSASPGCPDYPALVLPCLYPGLGYPALLLPCPTGSPAGLPEEVPRTHETQLAITPAARRRLRLTACQILGSWRLNPSESAEGEECGDSSPRARERRKTESGPGSLRIGSSLLRTGWVPQGRESQEGAKRRESAKGAILAILSPSREERAGPDTSSPPLRTVRSGPESGVKDDSGDSVKNDESGDYGDSVTFTHFLR